MLRRITDDVIVPETVSAFYFTEAGEILLVEEGVTVVSEGAAVIQSYNLPGVAAHINGSVLGPVTGVSLVTQSQVRVGPTGEVLASGKFGSAAVLLGSSGRLENAGTIASGLGSGIAVADGCEVINDGVISGALEGVRMGSGSTLVNNGAIRCAGVGEAVSGEAFLYGHAVKGAGEDALVLNFGDIVASHALGAGVWNATRVENHGDIVSARFWGVDLAYLPPESEAVVTNFGLITGGAGGLRGSDYADQVLNAGRIVGDVELGDGADRFDGRGGTVAGAVSGLGGDDRLLAGGGDDAMDGGTGNDVASGFAGEDALYGGGGADELLGGRGDDSLDGGAWGDRIVGGAGDDLLAGGTGADCFVFGRAHGDDVVADFANADALDLRTLRLPGFAELRALATATADGALIDLSARGGGTILLADFALGRLTADDLLL